MHPDGLEPPTYSSVDCRSIQLSYGCFSIADMDHRIQPGFGKAKIQAPAKLPPSVAESTGASHGLSLLSQGGCPYEVVIGSSGSICLMQITQLSEETPPSHRESLSSRRAEAGSGGQWFRSHGLLRGHASRPPS
jgi:hypothetical protein